MYFLSDGVLDNLLHRRFWLEVGEYFHISVPVVAEAVALVSNFSGLVANVLDDLVGAGIKAILNFAPRVLEAPDDVMVSNVDLAVEVEYLSYSLANR